MERLFFCFVRGVRDEGAVVSRSSRALEHGCLYPVFVKKGILDRAFCESGSFCFTRVSAIKYLTFSRQPLSAGTMDFATKETRSGFPMAVVLYRSPHYGVGEKPRVLSELQIMWMNCTIRNKDFWWIKVKDQSITDRWIAEAMAQSHTTMARYDSAEHRLFRIISYAIEECKWLADQYSEGPSRPAAVDGVFERRDLQEIEGGALLQNLCEGIASLRKRPAIGSNDIDRHPGTPQMIDLVHPSMYCYERGVTPVLQDGDASTLSAPEWIMFLLAHRSTVDPLPKEDPNDHSHSLHSKTGLQWLPSEFYATETGVQINSYINSLHPHEDAAMYASISRLFHHVLPVLEDALSQVGLENSLNERSLRITVNPYGWWREPELTERNFENEDLYWDYWQEFRENEANLDVPDIPDFTPPTYTMNHWRNSLSLRDRPLQVIVKVASLELEPGETYQGGVWHVEGALDERIVATACCYIESENIQGGDLQFRACVSEPEYEQNDNVGVSLIFGLEDEEPLVQNRGACTTRAGMVLAWPNTMQHRVSPVQLIDPTLPGKRTIVCFFLVDPTLRVRSTATVPPQQKDWVDRAVNHVLGNELPESGILSKITGHYSCMTYEEACERRDRLMSERGALFAFNYHEGFFQRPFSLCEH